MQANDSSGRGGGAAGALLALAGAVIFVVRIENAQALQSNHAHHVEDDQRNRR